MRVYLWYFGEDKPRTIREDGPGKFLRTTRKLDTGTEFAPGMAEHFVEGLRWASKRNGGRFAVWRAE